MSTRRGRIVSAKIFFLDEIGARRGIIAGGRDGHAVAVVGVRRPYGMPAFSISAAASRRSTRAKSQSNQ